MFNIIKVLVYELSGKNITQNKFQKFLNTFMLYSN